jgi:transcriptional regulator with GAF, ATPase, and Fis domain
VRTDAEALAALDGATTTPSLLGILAEALTDVLEADACLISRAIGEMLVDLVEHTASRSRLPGGHGYLISDFPQTQQILRDGTSATVSVDDPAADEQEVALLKQLGFSSLLMVPIVVRDDTWGLAEVYGSRRFTDDDVGRIQPLLTRAGELISQLGA